MRPRPLTLLSIALLTAIVSQAGLAEQATSPSAAPARLQQGPAAARPAPTAAATRPAVRPLMSSDAQHTFVNDYCSGCHNDRVKSGGMTLTTFDPAHPEATPELA